MKYSVHLYVYAVLCLQICRYFSPLYVHTLTCKYISSEEVSTVEPVERNTSLLYKLFWTTTTREIIKDFTLIEFDPKKIYKFSKIVSIKSVFLFTKKVRDALGHKDLLATCRFA